MKISKEELKQKVTELVPDNDVAIQLLEDIEDSMEDGSNDNTALDELQTKYNELQEKYKQRFLDNVKEEKEEKEDVDDEGMKEEEIIDIKEI